MTIFDNDPKFTVQVFETDENLEPEKFQKLMLRISTDNDADPVFNKEDIDRKMFVLFVELIYGRTKMELLDNENIDNVHQVSVRKTAEIVEDMPFEKFTPQAAKHYLEKTRKPVKKTEEE